jgi:hypothetical protein
VKLFVSQIQIPENPLHLLIMPSTTVVSQAVDRAAADAAHAELVKFVDMRSPGVVDKRIDAVLNFEGYLKTLDMQKTNALLADFLDVCGAFEITLCALLRVDTI